MPGLAQRSSAGATPDAAATAGMTTAMVSLAGGVALGGLGAWLLSRRRRMRSGTSDQRASALYDTGEAAAGKPRRGLFSAWSYRAQTLENLIQGG
jgi:hypothetical protein